MKTNLLYSDIGRRLVKSEEATMMETLVPAVYLKITDKNMAEDC